tara:strand:+ start:284 stop:457 length:174 start_codon:yes stop_codon:yes gene_type:complete
MKCFAQKPVNRKPVDRWEYEFLINGMLKKLNKYNFKDVKKIYQIVSEGYPENQYRRV